MTPKSQGVTILPNQCCSAIDTDRSSLRCYTVTSDDRRMHPMKGGLIGMNWFRKHVKGGSRLALLALALQFALSFGHFHGIAAKAAPAFQSGAAQSDIADPGNDAVTPQAAQQPSPADHEPDQ